MTDFLPQPNADGLVKLSGTVRNLKVTRGTASFVFTESDQTKMGVIAVAAAVAGMGGQAMSTAANASAMEEEADYLEFELDGKPVKGWVWRNPFNEGDVVEVAAEQADGHWEAYGVTRKEDKTISLYPHCSRGMKSHTRNAVKWWVWGTLGVLIFGASVFSLMSIISYVDILENLAPIFFVIYVFSVFVIYLRFGVRGVFYISFPLLAYGAYQLIKSKDSFLLIQGAVAMSLGFFGFFALMTWSLTRKWMPFVRLAEKVFHALEFPDPSNIDLVKSSKAQRRPDDPGELGTFYFRY